MICKQIPLDDLTSVMMSLDSARVILGEVSVDYFCHLDPRTDRSAMAWDFPRSRAKILAVEELLFSIEKDLHALGADPGYPGYKERQQHEAQ